MPQKLWVHPLSTAAEVSTTPNTTTNTTIYYTTVYITHTPGPIFHGRYFHNLEQCRCQKGRLWKNLAKSFPDTRRSVSALSRLSSNRDWKTAQGGGVVYTVVHVINTYFYYHVLVLY